MAMSISYISMVRWPTLQSWRWISVRVCLCQQQELAYSYPDMLSVELLSRLGMLRYAQT